jgi:hypothetical protein
MCVFEVVDLDVVRRILYQKKPQYENICRLVESEERISYPVLSLDAAVLL